MFQALQFLDGFLNIGQGIFIFFIFICDRALLRKVKSAVRQLDRHLRKFVPEKVSFFKI